MSDSTFINTAKRSHIVLAGAIALSYPIALLIVGAIGGDSLVLQKIVSGWLMPVGLLFIVVSFAATMSLLRKQSAACLACIFALVLLVFAIDPLTNVFVKSLENRFTEFDFATTEPFDAVIVLGGATGLTPSERPQLNAGGERVVLAAELYQQKLAEKIFVTGNSMQEKVAGDEPSIESPRRQASEILQRLGVPESAIVLVEGRTTSLEMQNLKSLPQLQGLKRVGLITSAMHLPRAMRLAKTNDLTFLPIPANFTANSSPMTVLNWIPNASNVEKLQAVLHEYLGMLKR